MVRFIPSIPLPHSPPPFAKAVSTDFWPYSPSFPTPLPTSSPLVHTSLKYLIYISVHCDLTGIFIVQNGSPWYFTLLYVLHFNQISCLYYSFFPYPPAPITQQSSMHLIVPSFMQMQWIFLLLTLHPLCPLLPCFQILYLF